MKKLKTVLIVWISIYPLITLVNIFCLSYLTPYPVYIRTFILTIILVPTMVYILIPFWTKVIDNFEARWKKE